jgi:hypothetical protein
MITGLSLELSESLYKGRQAPAADGRGWVNFHFPPPLEPDSMALRVMRR